MNPSILNTDMYQICMAKTHFQTGMSNKIGVAEAFYRGGEKRKYPYYVMCGAHRIAVFIRSLTKRPEEAVLHLDEGGLRLTIHDFAELMKVTHVYCRRNGDILFPQEPAVQIVGPLPIVHLLETQILSILNHDVKIATVAADIRNRTDKDLYEFGSRRTDVQSAEHAAWAAIASGFNGTSNVAAGIKYNLPVVGTMSHAFVLSYENELDAFVDFLMHNPLNGTLLIDTYDTKAGCANAIKASLKTGVPLKGIRIDSGNLERSAENAWELLQSMRMNDTKIIVSGDLDAGSIRDLGWHYSIDAFGVGTKLVSPDFNPGFVYKLVEVDGRPVSKKSKGKATLPYRKSVIQNGALQHTIRYGASAPSGFELLETLHEASLKPEEAFENFTETFKRLKLDDDFIKKPNEPNIIADELWEAAK